MCIVCCLHLKCFSHEKRVEQFMYGVRYRDINQNASNSHEYLTFESTLSPLRSQKQLLQKSFVIFLFTLCLRALSSSDSLYKNTCGYCFIGRSSAPEVIRFSNGKSNDE